MKTNAMESLYFHFSITCIQINESRFLLIKQLIIYIVINGQTGKGLFNRMQTNFYRTMSISQDKKTKKKGKLFGYTVTWGDLHHSIKKLLKK